MKSLIVLSALSLSLSLFAVTRTEYDQKDEKVCYEEARKIGCVKGDAAADVACTKSKKAILSKKCTEVLSAQ
jgi:hypothetical protein